MAEVSEKNAVLWDMDGVLVDTADVHFSVWKELLVDYGITITRDMFNHIFGMDNSSSIRYLFGHPVDEKTAAEIIDRKESTFRKVMPGKIPVLPGVRSWLARLHELGFRQAVASSAPQENIDAILDDLDLCRYFDAVVSAGRYPGKPDPAVFLHAAEELGVPPERCTVIEDSIAGVEAAKRAGMRCVAVTNTHPAQSLSKADLVVDSLEDLSESDFLPAP